MNFNKQIRSLLSVPSYRVRLLFFVTLGSSAILGSLLIKDPYWRDILSNFAVTFIAVGLIDFIWDVLGGDPSESKMAEGFSKLELKIDAVKPATKMLSDMVENNIGIERIWPSRRDWDNDIYDGLRMWQKRICRAQSVSIVSNTFWTRWFDDEDFRRGFFENLVAGAKVRLLIYDPEAEILEFRALDENDPRSKWGLQMQSEIVSTLRKIAERLISQSEDNEYNLDIRLTNKSYHLAQLIQADNRILVSNYLSGKSGSPSPTFQVAEPSRYFSTYSEQINILWSRGKLISSDEIKKLVFAN